MASRRAALARSTFVRDAVVATAALVVLYGVGRGVRFQPLQIPAYLLIVGFDLLEATFGSAGAFYYVLFGLYLVVLGLIGAGVATGLRRLANGTTLPAWRLGLAGALAIVGVLSLGFAALVSLNSTQTQPVKTTATAGVVLLALAGLLAKAVGTSARPA